MILRWLLYLLLFWWLGRLLGRLLRPPRAMPPRTPPQRHRGDLSHLTQQEISDADYEEIP